MDDKIVCACCKIGLIEDDWCDICSVCGWEQDRVQEKDHDFAGGANDLSLNEHRKRFQKLRKKDPNYTWHNEIVKYNYGKRKPTKLKRKATTEDVKKYNKWNTLDKL